MRLLTCKNLDIGYHDGLVARDINFHIDEGDYLCILGENGSGKTTLMKTILGLTPPIAGEIIFAGGLIAREIGYMPQQTLLQRDFPASVREIVLSGTLGKSSGQGVQRFFYSAEQKKTAAANMQRLGIKDLAGKCYRDLSGGQKQRVLLARALCAASRMLLLDEPAASLDPKATEELYVNIKKLNDEGLSIIMITHDLAAARAYANKTLTIGKDIVFHE